MGLLIPAHFRVLRRNYRTVPIIIIQPRPGWGWIDRVIRCCIHVFFYYYHHHHSLLRAHTHLRSLLLPWYVRRHAQIPSSHTSSRITLIILLPSHPPFRLPTWLTGTYSVLLKWVYVFPEIMYLSSFSRSVYEYDFIISRVRNMHQNQPHIDSIVQPYGKLLINHDICQFLLPKIDW